MSRRSDGTLREHLRQPGHYARPVAPVTPEAIARRAAAEAEAESIWALKKAKQQAAHGTVETTQAQSTDRTEGAA